MSEAPLLDNIETSSTSIESGKPLTDKEFEALADDFLYSDQLEELEKYKQLSVETAEALLEFGNGFDWKDRARTMRDCGTFVTFGGGKVVGANFCRLRLCPMCQRRKSLKTFSDFSRILQELRAYSFLHLVLTVPNVKAEDLGGTVDALNKCSSRLFAMKDVSKAFEGVARCLEVSFNSNTINFHPHLHCLVAVSKSYFTSRKYIKHADLRRWWSALWRLREENLKRKTDDYIKDFDLLNDDLLQIFISKANEGALPEIAKYAVKPLAFNGKRKQRAFVLQALFEALHGRRLIQTYGVIKEVARKLNIDLNEADEKGGELDNKKTYSYYYNYQHSHYERRE